MLEAGCRNCNERLNRKGEWCGGIVMSNFHFCIVQQGFILYYPIEEGSGRERTPRSEII